MLYFLLHKRNKLPSYFLTNRGIQSGDPVRHVLRECEIQVSRTMVLQFFSQLSLILLAFDTVESLKLTSKPSFLSPKENIPKTGYHSKRQ